MCCRIMSGAYLIISTGISSHPGDFPGFSLDTAFLTSAIVNGILIGVGCICSIGSAFLQKIVMKYDFMIFDYSTLSVV